MNTATIPQSAAAWLTDDERWAAVVARAREADGQFYYSVRSTGVYCRPSCPSRTPRRANVAFYATPGDAEAAGFRACLRCRPDAPPLAERQAEAVAKACRLIEPRKNRTSPAWPKPAA
jgi:AraC family transcriptional regulator of adaptative response/methylated-DNA-[protein]-cysteine methyltransferase